MSSNQSLWAELQNTFAQDIPATAELLDILQRERKALEQRDYDEFQKIIGGKQTLLSQLQSHAATRQQLLQQAGFNDESSTLIAAEKQAPLVASAWRDLAQQWTHCQELNAVKACK